MSVCRGTSKWKEAQWHAGALESLEHVPRLHPSLRTQEAWHHLKFWLWAVARYAAEVKIGTDGAPPVLVVGTKWSQSHETFNAEEINRRIDGLLLQLPRLRQQLQRVNTRCGWLHRVENFDSDSEKYIQPLRDRLQQLARDILTPRRE